MGKSLRGGIVGLGRCGLVAGRGFVVVGPGGFWCMVGKTGSPGVSIDTVETV